MQRGTPERPVGAFPRRAWEQGLCWPASHRRPGKLTFSDSAVRLRFSPVASAHDFSPSRKKTAMPYRVGMLAALVCGLALAAARADRRRRWRRFARWGIRKRTNCWRPRNSPLRVSPHGQTPADGRLPDGFGDWKATAAGRTRRGRRCWPIRRDRRVQPGLGPIGGRSVCAPNDRTRGSLDRGRLRFWRRIDLRGLSLCRAHGRAILSARRRCARQTSCTRIAPT